MNLMAYPGLHTAYYGFLKLFKKIEVDITYIILAVFFFWGGLLCVYNIYTHILLISFTFKPFM